MEEGLFYGEEDEDEPSAVQQMDETLAQMRALREGLLKETNLVDERDRAAEVEHARLQSSLLSSVRCLMGQVANDEYDAAAQALSDAWKTGPACGEAAARAHAASVLSSAYEAGITSGHGARGSTEMLEACAAEAKAGVQLSHSDAATVCPAATAPACAEDSRSARKGAAAGHHVNGVKSEAACSVVAGAVSSVSRLASQPLLPPSEASMPRSGRARGRGVVGAGRSTVGGSTAMRGRGQ